MRLNDYDGWGVFDRGADFPKKNISRYLYCLFHDRDLDGDRLKPGYVWVLVDRFGVRASRKAQERCDELNAADFVRRANEAAHAETDSIASEEARGSAFRAFVAGARWANKEPR